MPQVERDRLGDDASRLNLADVEDVGDDRLKVLAGITDRRQALAL